MIEVRQIADLQARLDSNPAVLVYFSQPKCGVCTALKPMLEAEMKKHYPKVVLLYVNTLEQSEIAGQFGIFTIPVVLIFFEQRESLRISRNVNVKELIERLKRPYKLLFG